MGSRRRPSTRLDLEDDYATRGSSSESTTSLQLLPNIKTSARNEIQDYLGHQKWHAKRQPAIHPALTDFGPESLHKFLQNELEKLRVQAVGALLQTQQDQEQELRRFALELVNAPGGVYAAKENGKKTFKMYKNSSTVTSWGGLQRKDSSSGKGKGKAAAPRKPAPARTPSKPVKIAQTDGANLSVDDFELTLPRPLQTTIHTPNRAFRKSVNNIVNRRRSGSRANDDAWDGSRPTKRSSRVNLFRSPLGSHGLLQKNAVEEDVDMVDEPTLDGNIDLDTLDTSARAKVETTLSSYRRPSRASSFEDHASSSRTTRRSRDKPSSPGAQPNGEPRRRRKTPAVTQDEIATGAIIDTSAGHPISASAPTPSQLHHTSSIDRDRVSHDTVSKDRGSGTSNLGSRSRTHVAAVVRQELQRADAADDSLALSEVDSLDDDIGIENMQAICETGEQYAIWESMSQIKSAARIIARKPPSEEELKFPYGNTVPEQMPANVRQAELNRCKIWNTQGFDDHGKKVNRDKKLSNAGPFSDAQLDPGRPNFLHAPDEHGDYPRTYSRPASADSRSPPSRSVGDVMDSLPIEIWEAGVLQYLSSAEVRSLRLVCKSLAHDLEPYVFRSVVTKFGPSMFNLYPSYTKEGKLNVNTSFSMLKKHGAGINKFGISFDYDAPGLGCAPFKVTESTVDAWFGRYKWPISDYPYFASLKDIDKLLDDERRLLTQAMRNLDKCSELAISVDSGHGWLEGPDVSDLALYRERACSGSKVFGKTFGAADRASENGMKELFEWAQHNTINENIKYLDNDSGRTRDEVEKLRRIIIRDYDSFQCERAQHDYSKDLHTGGVASADLHGQPQNAPQVPGAMGQLALLQPLGYHMQIAMQGPQVNHRPYPQQRFASVLDLVQNNVPAAELDDKIEAKREGILPQWPLIFNGYNLAAEPRGDTPYIQNRVAAPSEFPILPNNLTEAQAQWLMETSWIQRTFLSAYTDAVRVNSFTFQNVHSLHIAKISSGLLPALSQRGFWTALPALRKVTMLVKPDWRVEHIPGDKYFQTTMTSQPVIAAYKFAELLRDFISRLENLNSLHIGYFGGGEHQSGLFGRNQHILPAPITSNPREWLVAQNPAVTRPDNNSMFVFSHIRTLTFENCWFSPCMLETFMHKSRDTSLHNLVLDSVSLTAQTHSNRGDGPLRTVENGLKCHQPSAAWLSETLPSTASWVNVLDKITPGPTILDKKYGANMINEEEVPRPEPVFKGNVQQITLKSCGYVRVLGIPSSEFNQNDIVFQNPSWCAMDDGLRVRACAFSKVVPVDQPATHPEDFEDGQDDSALRRGAVNTAVNVWLAGDSLNTPRVDRRSQSQQQQLRDAMPRTISRSIMLCRRQAHIRSENFSQVDSVATDLTAFLTQCIHPIEKRVLERMWGVRFGWGDDMKRWEAVEDGWFMGGTGRFSGVVGTGDMADTGAYQEDGSEDE